MIIDTTNNPISYEAVNALYPRADNNSYLVVEHDSGKKLLRTKVPFERAGWILDQLPPHRRCAISSSTYYGKRILANHRATGAISVALDYNKICGLRTPQAVFQKVNEELSSQNCPSPTVAIVTPSEAIVVWIVDRPFDFLELGEAHAIEVALTTALSKFAVTSTQTASRSLPLPINAPHSGQSVAWATNGSLKKISRERLQRAAQPLITYERASSLAMTCEGIEELGALLHARCFELCTHPAHHPLWMTGYAGTCAPFVNLQELKDTIRGIVESVGLNWQTAKQEKITAVGFTYEDYLAVQIRNARVQKVKVGGDYFDNFDPMWLSRLADLLCVSPAEIEALALRRLVPSGRKIEPKFPDFARARFCIGVEDYVPLYEFLNAA